MNLNLNPNKLPKLTDKEKLVLEEALIYLLNGDQECASFEEGLRNVVAILLDKDECTFTKEELFKWYDNLNG